MASSVRLDKARLSAYINALPGKAERVVAKVAHDIEADAKQRAPVDTGFLRSSIAAKAEGPARWVVSVGAEYGAFVEFGTHKAAAQPYFVPAFTQAVKQVAAIAKVEMSP